MSNKKWMLLNDEKINSIKQIVRIILKNRGIEDEKGFFNPIHPEKISLKSLGINKLNIDKSVKRIKEAKKKKEHIIIYGDYDADGISATAILWEFLYSKGYNVLPYIPERFSEGYGINSDSVQKLKTKDQKLKLIVTVDNGIVAHEGIKKAKELGIDVIVVDHHQKSEKKLSSDYILHSTKVCGSVLAYLFAKQITDDYSWLTGMELVAIGTVSDQMVLTGINRSFVKYGLENLNVTKRLGLKAILREARVEKAGVYEIGFIIAPRLNATGRLTHAIDSLRLLCTRNFYKANELALLLGKVNSQRQKIVEEVLLKVEKSAQKDDKKVIVLSGDYHEGVIGLAAGKITEKYFRPSIVISKKDEISKASARSVPGFDIIKAIKKLKDLIVEGGGHEMAAGFSIQNKNIRRFRQEINKIANKELKNKDLIPKIKIDMKLNFNQLNYDLVREIKKFEPFGSGNPAPVFVSKKVKVVEAKKVGADRKHLKLKLEKNGIILDAIAFGLANVYPLRSNDNVDIVYSIEENIFNGNKSIQLKIKDIKIYK